MKKTLVLLVGIIVAGVANGQDYEKVAFEYFVESILPDQFPEVRKIKFSGKTENLITNANYFEDCYNKESEFLNAIKGEFENKSRIDIPVKENLKKIIKVCTIPENYKKTYLSIDRANITETNVFVAVNIQEKDSFYNSYFITINKDGEILDWCYSGEVY